MPGHYDLLGIPPDATVDDIRRAYHRKARVLHPDAHPAAPTWVTEEMQRAMAELNEAWRVLSDDELRRVYDGSLEGPRPITMVRRPAPARRYGDPIAKLGPGFYHYGASRYWIRRDGRRTRGLVLGVETTDLSPLDKLGPHDVLGIHADDVALSDDALRHVAHLRSLRMLDLGRTAVGDGGLRHLRGLPLESLAVHGTSVGDAGLAQIARLGSLRDLNLSGTRVTDAGLSHLSALGRLQTLVVRGTAVTGQGLRALDPLSALRILALPSRVAMRERRRLRTVHPGIVLT